VVQRLLLVAHLEALSQQTFLMTMSSVLEQKQRLTLALTLTFMTVFQVKESGLSAILE
jgi:hypothetical protein